jgi:histidyl-tRNA synthetase
VREHGLMPLSTTIAEIALVVRPETVGAGARLASSLREQGLRVDLSLQPHRSIGDQLKLANRKGIQVAVILGSSEFEAGTATLKDLRDGDQRTVSVDDLVEVVRSVLEQTVPVGAWSQTADG